MFFINSRRLNNSSGTPITALALTSGVAVNSEAIAVDRNVGFGVLTLKEDKAGGAGDVDVYAEYSEDGTTWNKAYTTASGSLTVDADIVTTLQNATRRIQFTPRMAKYIRFVFDPDADSQITADFAFQEED